MLLELSKYNDGSEYKRLGVLIGGPEGKRRVVEVVKGKNIAAIRWALRQDGYSWTEELKTY